MNTDVIKIEELNSDSLAELQKSADVIKNGGLVVFPTETVYGLGADATNEDAVAKIYTAKGRPSDNPLIIHIAKPEDAESYTYTSPVYYELARKFMPGPLTVIMRSRDNVPRRTRGGLDTVAVRCPSNEVARRLIELSQRPIAAPSANLSGSPSPTVASHVIDDMLGRVDVIIDGGNCDVGVESTIVKINDDETVTLLRPGKITVEELESVADVDIADAVIKELREDDVALSPGMKYKHYAPKAQLILLDGTPTEVSRYLSGLSEKNIAVISYSEDIEIISRQNDKIVCFDFGKRAELEFQAQRLFFLLREIDKRNFDVIFAPLPPKEGIGLALYNRMIRAAAHKIIKIGR